MVILYPLAEDLSLSTSQTFYGTIVNEIFHFSVKIPNTVSLILLSFCLNELNKRAGLKSNNETLRCRYKRAMRIDNFVLSSGYCSSPVYIGHL